MRYLLDSNVIIALILDSSERLTRRVAECDEGELVTSVVAYAEVAWGSLNKRAPLIEVLQRFALSVPVLDFDQIAALAYAALPFERASYDHLIAAHAIALDLTIVTDNTKHFARLPGVSVENWM